MQVHGVTSRNLNAISIRDVLAVLFKYQRAIVVLILLTLLLVVGYAYWFPEVYLAEAKLLVKPGRQNTPSDVIESPLRQQLNTNVLRKEDITSEAEIIRSRASIERAIADVGAEVLSPPLVPAEGWWGMTRYWMRIAGRSVMSFLREVMVMLGLTVETSEAQRLVLSVESRVKVAPVQNSDVIRVTFSWPYPVAAADFVNRLVARHVDRHLAIHKGQHLNAVMTSQVEGISKRLGDVEAGIASLKRKSGIVAIGEQRTLLLRQQNFLESSIQAANEKIAETRSRLVIARAQIANERATLEVGEGDGRNPVIDHLRLRLATLESEEEEILRKYDESSGVVVQKRQAVADARRRLEQEVLVARKAAAGGTPAALAKLREDERRLESELEGGIARERELSRQVREVTQRLSQLDSHETEIVRLGRDQKMLEGQLLVYQVKQEELRVADVMDERRITSVAIAAAAMPPIEPQRILSLLPNRIFYILAGLFGSLVAGAALAFILDYLDSTVDTVRKVEVTIGAPVLGSLPALDHPDTGARTMLSGLSERLPADAKLLLMCSATTGEGVSTVAAVVAASLATERTKRVLLVDFNFRDPPRGLLAIAGKPGMADVAPDQIETAVIKSDLDRLWLLPRGVANANVAAVLDRPGLSEALQRLAGAYDYVLLDAPAVLAHPDALVLGRLGVHALVVVDSQATRVEVLGEAVNRLTAVGSRVAGGVMNFRKYYVPNAIYRRV